MKNILSIIVVSFLFALSSFGQGVTGYFSYSTGGQQYAAEATTNYAVIGVESKTGGEPIVTYINATSDLSSSKIQFYGTTNKTQVVGTTNAVDKGYCYVNSTNLFVPGDFILIEHINSTNTYNIPSTYELNSCSNFGTIYSTNIVLSGGANASYTNYVYAFTNLFAMGAVYQPGDNIYQLTTVGQGNIPVGSATVTITGSSGIYAGIRNKPLVMILKGTSAATINAVSANFAP